MQPAAVLARLLRLHPHTVVEEVSYAAPVRLTTDRARIGFRNPDPAHRFVQVA